MEQTLHIKIILQITRNLFCMNWFGIMKVMHYIAIFHKKLKKEEEKRGFEHYLHLWQLGLMSVHVSQNGKQNLVRVFVVVVVFFFSP